ncbi:hypothetical protein D3C71_1522010 [compost metagenome]
MLQGHVRDRRRHTLGQRGKGALQAYLALIGNDRSAHETLKTFLQCTQADVGQLRQLRAADQVLGVLLNVLDGQLHMPWR